MKKQDKFEIVDQLTESFEKYKFFYITDTSQLSANSINNFRRMLNKSGVTMQVAKNTLILKALEATGKNYGELPSILKGTSAILFTEDVKAPAKIIKDFRQKNDKPALKGAYVDSDIFIGDNQLEALISLKSKNDLLGEVIGLLQSPAQNVISALQSNGQKIAGILKTLSEREAN